MGLLKKIFGDANERLLTSLWPLVEEIGEREAALEVLTLEELRQESEKLRSRAQAGEPAEELLVEGFSLVREAAKRVLGQRHFDVQLLGGIALFQGKVVEMKTGEGKTLAATAPAYVRALGGKGAHIVTVNDYLAKRDTVWMGQIYHALGLSVGCLAHEAAYLYDPEHKNEIRNQNDRIVKLDQERDLVGGFRVVQEFLRPAGRAEAYRADILYGTNHEFGFDYLRDHLVYNVEDLAQKELSYAIVDEVDSILIDEARTPLIISAPDEDAARLYKEFARLIPRLEENRDYNVDEKMKSVALTEGGIERMAHTLGRDIYREGNLVLIHHLEEALKAHILFRRDRDYVVKGTEVIIVDEFTGRLMHGRRYTGGLHQALEAKERLPVKQESRIFAKITLQNYFRLYGKLAGMTGTAATSAEEFHKVYGLDVAVIPTDKPMIREDFPDQIFQTKRGKFQAVAREIKIRQEKGQPVLVGTISIENNELLSSLLKREGVEHEVLNAKNHEREALIIAQAGKLGAVTVATNMAGRGVDIILGGNPQDIAEAEKILEMGGLHVLGTERHEARRIDNQLRGRSGRQGDPGSSQIFVSLEDDLMRIFGSDRIKNLMGRFGIPEDEPIQHSMVSKALDAAQAKIEGLNFDARKHVLEYDDVLAKQRETVYRKRQEILFMSYEALRDFLREAIRKDIERLVRFHRDEEGVDVEELYEVIRSILNVDAAVREKLAELSGGEDRELGDYIFSIFSKALEDLEGKLGQNALYVWRGAVLRVLDILWVGHLETMENLTDSVRLRAYGQHDPLVEYKNEGFRLFRSLLEEFEIQLLQWIFRLKMNVEK